MRRLSAVVLMFCSLFPVVSYENQQFRNRYSSCLVEPDIELNDEWYTPGWAIIPLHRQFVAESARNEELLWGFYCR